MTKADFYIANLEEYEWLGSIVRNGYPIGIPTRLLKSVSEQGFREAVRTYISETPEKIFPNLGWPWIWVNSNFTDYGYVFYNGRVYASHFGCRWFDPVEDPYRNRKYFLWIETPLLDFPKMIENPTTLLGDING